MSTQVTPSIDPITFEILSMLFAESRGHYAVKEANDARECGKAENCGFLWPKLDHR